LLAGLFNHPLGSTAKGDTIGIVVGLGILFGFI
jgi:hypothetical protein